MNVWIELKNFRGIEYLEKSSFLTIFASHNFSSIKIETCDSSQSNFLASFYLHATFHKTQRDTWKVIGRFHANAINGVFQASSEMQRILPTASDDFKSRNKHLGKKNLFYSKIFSRKIIFNNIWTAALNFTVKSMYYFTYALVH